MKLKELDAIAEVFSVKERRQSISYDLKDPYLESLEKTAEALGMSLGQATKRIVIQHLMNIQLDRMQYQLDRVEAHAGALHEGMAKGFEQMITQLLMTQDKMINVGVEQTDDEEDEAFNVAKRDAKKWVDTHIRREDSPSQ